MGKIKRYVFNSSIFAVNLLLLAGAFLFIKNREEAKKQVQDIIAGENISIDIPSANQTIQAVPQVQNPAPVSSPKSIVIPTPIPAPAPVKSSAKTKTS